MNYNKIPKKTNDKVFSSVKASIDYLVEENLLEREKQCVYCCGIVKIIEDPSYNDKHIFTDALISGVEKKKDSLTIRFFLQYGNR